MPRCRDAAMPRMSRRLFARRTSTWLLAGGAVTVLAACGAGDAASKDDLAALRKEVTALKRAGSEEGAAADAHGAAAKPGAKPAVGHDAKHRAYEGAASPEKWGELAPENAVCSSGSTQSPIDIASTQAGGGGAHKHQMAACAAERPEQWAHDPGRRRQRRCDRGRRRPVYPRAVPLPRAVRAHGGRQTLRDGDALRAQERQGRTGRPRRAARGGKGQRGARPHLGGAPEEHRREEGTAELRPRDRAAEGPLDVPLRGIAHDPPRARRACAGRCYRCPQACRRRR